MGILKFLMWLDPIETLVNFSMVYQLIYMVVEWLFFMSDVFMFPERCQPQNPISEANLMQCVLGNRKRCASNKSSRFVWSILRKLECGFKIFETTCNEHLCVFAIHGILVFLVKVLEPSFSVRVDWCLMPDACLMLEFLPDPSLWGWVWHVFKHQAASKQASSSKKSRNPVFSESQFPMRFVFLSWGGCIHVYPWAMHGESVDIHRRSVDFREARSSPNFQVEGLHGLDRIP